MPTEVARDPALQRVFISYDHSDRSRVDGLERLLTLFGHEVFIDYRSIGPGLRWKDEIDKALEQTDVMLVFWTSAAAESVDVKREYEYVLEHVPERPVVPILGDETPLPVELEEREWLTFLPLINELLARKRDLEARGWKAAEIQRDLCARLEEAGIHLEPSDRKRIWRFFGVSGWLAWVSFPLVLLGRMGRQLIDAATQLSPAQIVLTVCTAGAAAVIAIQPALHEAAQMEARATSLVEQLRQSNDDLRDARSAIAERQGVIEQLEETNDDLRNALHTEVLWREEVLEYLRPIGDLARIDLSSGDELLTVQMLEAGSDRHCCTILLPSNRTISFFVPPGSYRAYYALGPLSAGIISLIPEDATHSVYDIHDLQISEPLKLVVRTVDEDPPAVDPKDWPKNLD